MAQACNAVEFNGNGTAAANAIWSTQTAGEGTPPCALTVTGANGGNLILLDSTGQQYFRAIPAPTSAATTVSTLSSCNPRSRALQPSEHAMLLPVLRDFLAPPAMVTLANRHPILVEAAKGEVAQGMWRTPHPSPDIGNSTKGLSGASAVAMAYLTDGTVVFAERPHPLADGITNNPLIVNVSPSLLIPHCKPHAISL